MKYAGGFPADVNAPFHPLPFLYMPTGGETRFMNLSGLHPMWMGAISLGFSGIRNRGASWKVGQQVAL